MKKVILSLAVILLVFAVSFVGCQKEGIKSDDPVAYVNIDFEKIGNEHNKGLDHIYNFLKSGQNEKHVKLKSGNSDLYELIEDASVSFVKTSEYGNGIEKGKFSEILGLTSEDISLRRKSTDASFLDFLTDKQQYYTSKYMEIIMSMENEIEPVIKKLKKLDTEIMSNCTPEEAAPLLAATSVGRNSLQYWNDNLYKWAALLSVDQSTFLIPRLKGGYEVNTNDEEWEWFKSTLVSMGQSDGVGALIGLGLGAPVGGVGAVPGAIAGACNASAGAAIKSLFQRWGIF